jgi:hypothetical protein
MGGRKRASAIDAGSPLRVDIGIRKLASIKGNPPFRLVIGGDHSSGAFFLLHG